MSLDYALLGFLNFGPKTGYELQRKIKNSINYFWTSTQSQIYRTLSRMENESLIVSKIHYQDDKPNKKIYSITSKGKDELIKWLSTPINIPNHRNPFLIQFFFSGNLEKETIKSNLLHYKKEMEKRLCFLQSVEAEKMAALAGNKMEYFIYLSLIDNGISVLQSEINWVNKSLNKIENL